MEEKIKFSNKQISFLKEQGINPDNYDEVYNKINELLMVKGFDVDYNPTKIGIMCEAILDYMVEEGY